jgi:hypothetical protein
LDVIKHLAFFFATNSHSVVSFKENAANPFEKESAAYEYITVNDESVAFVTAIYRSILLYSDRTLRQDVLARRFHFEMASSKPSAFTSA